MTNIPLNRARSDLQILEKVGGNSLPPRDSRINTAESMNYKDGGRGIRSFPPVVGEFRKRPEFLSFFNLIPSGTCATFSLFFCTRSSPSSGWFNPEGYGPLLQSPS